MRKKESPKHCISQPSQQSPSRSVSPVRLARSPSRVCPLSKSVLRELQSELRSQHGYTLSPSCLPALEHYCESHRLLRRVLAARAERRANGFLREYSRLHSEERVGKLYSVFLDQEHQMRRNSKLYSRECLFDYFQLAGFAQDTLAGTLARRVAEGRAKGLVAVEERRKKKRTRCQFEEKENREAPVRAGRFEESKLFFAILALKLLLKEPELNTERISRSCEEIRNALDECLQHLRVRLEGSSIKSTRSSIFRRL